MEHLDEFDKRTLVYLQIRIIIEYLPASRWQEWLDWLARVDEDPEREAWKLEVMYALLERHPHLQQELFDKGRRIAARRSLRGVLAGRRLPLTADAEARIDACENLTTLERWIDQAVTAASAAEALS